MGVIPKQRGCRENPKVAKHLGIVANEIEEMSERPPGIPTQERDWDFRGGDMILVIQVVTFLGWWKRDPFKGLSDLQRLGIKRKMNGWNLQPSPMKRKENDLNQTSMRTCSMLIFRGVFGWWFQTFFIFIPMHGKNDPIWRANFSDGWEKTTN